MGSCLGTNSAAPPPKTPKSAAAHHDGCSKSPPPVYEENVKEVLCESPAVLKHRLLPIPRFHESEKMLHQNGGSAKKPGGGDPSGDFEIHSASFSTENDGGLRRPRLDGLPFSAEVKREKAAAGSPARRSGTSPGRVKPGYGSGRNTCGGELSGRKSRSPSPVTRSDSGSSKMGLDPRKTGNYPGRIEYGSGERFRKGKEEEEREPPTNIELLESSLVSLECFIFL